VDKQEYARSRRCCFGLIAVVGARKGTTTGRIQRASPECWAAVMMLGCRELAGQLLTAAAEVGAAGV
jgi:hypothetical protein